MPAKSCSVRPFLVRKVSASLKSALLAKNPKTYASALEANANSAEIEIEDFQDLMNLRLCFQLGPPRFNVGLYPLSATTAASEIWIRRQERPAASMGAEAHGEVDESREKDEARGCVWGGGFMCHSEPSLTFVGPKRECGEMGRIVVIVGRPRALNS